MAFHIPARRRPVSRLFTATVLACWFVTMLFGLAMLWRAVHHTRPAARVDTHWFAPPTLTERGFGRIDETERRP